MMTLPATASDTKNMESTSIWLDSPVTAGQMSLSANDSVRANKKAVECFQDRMNTLNKDFRGMDITTHMGMYVLDAYAIAVLNGDPMVVVAEYTSASQFHHKGNLNYKKHEQWMAGKYQVTTTKNLINITCK